MVSLITSVEPMENQAMDIQIVISRYNEDLEWLREEPFNKYPIICYNKGPNDDFYKPENMTGVKLKNVGRESHSYIHHIISNYDNLPENTMFLPGSCNIPYKKVKLNKLFQAYDEYKNTIFLCNYIEEGVKQAFYNFEVGEYVSTDSANRSLNSENRSEPAKIRPFGKWFEAHFGDKFVQHVNYHGMFCVNKKHILQHPKSYYENFFNEFTDSSNPEVGHYFERSWITIFSPMPDAKFIEHELNFNM